MADEIGLPNAKKKDSTGICFIGERPFREFLNRYLSHEPGPMRDDRGRELGRHVGLSFYTLGQRQGLGIGGKNFDGKAGITVGNAASTTAGDGLHAPWYVAHKDLAANTLHVVQGHDHRWLQSSWLEAEDLSWVAGHAPAPGALAAKTRYRQTDAPCTLTLRGEQAGCATLRLDFEAPQWAVTPGQSGVVYDGEVCLGGGVIARASTPVLPPAALPARGRRRAR